jgi:hypothetical protein
MIDFVTSLMQRLFPDAEPKRCCLSQPSGLFARVLARRVKKLSRALITAKTVFFDEGDQECQPNA